MRRKWRILTAAVLMLLLLSGCAGGGRDNQMQQEAAMESEDSVESWGTAIEAAPSPATSPTPTAAPSPSPSAEPTPTPTPEPESLREKVDTEVSVWVDGTELKGLMLADTTLVNSEDLTEIWPWFQWQEGTAQAVFTRGSGAPLEVSCVTVTGESDAAVSYSGDGGIYFAGQNTEYWLPLRWLTGQLEARLLWDGERGTAYVSSRVKWDAIPLGNGIPVLMYHAVSDDLWGISDLFVSPEEMRKQLEYLVEHGYDPIFFSDLPNLEDYDKPILLTFDDGYDDNYTLLYPLLQEFGVKATVFVITGSLGEEHYITAEQAKEMSDSGLVDIQSHTVNHYELATLSAEEQEYQLAQSQLEIARITGKIPYVLAYPSGSRNADTIDLAMEYYEFGIDMNGGTWYPQADETDFYKIDRIYISRVDSIDDFAAKVP